MGYEKKAQGLIRVIQSQNFTIHFAKLGFFANENFFVLRGNKHAAFWQTDGTKWSVTI